MGATGLLLTMKQTILTSRSQCLLILVAVLSISLGLCQGNQPNPRTVGTFSVKSNTNLELRLESQVKSLNKLSEKILIGLTNQTELTTIKLAECLQEISKLTRLVVANKRRTIPFSKLQEEAETVPVMFQGGMSERETVVSQQIDDKQVKPEFQMPPVLMKELNFYL